MVSKQEIFNALSKVIDPISNKDIISQAFLKTLEVDGANVQIELELLPQHSSVHQQDLKQQIVSTLQELSEDLIFNISFSKKQVAPPKKANPLPNVKNIVAVASGKGGVGKSTVTSNLAVALAKQGYSVGYLDADIYGPSGPTMFGVESERPRVLQHEGKNLLVPVEKHGVKIMSMGFLVEETQAVVWRGSMATSALRQFITDCEWGELDYMLIDLPPGTSDIHLTLVQTLPLTGAIIVTTPQKVAVADAKRGLSMFQQDKINVPVLGIVENMAYFTPAELPNNKYYIFGEDGGRELAIQNGVELLGQIPIVQSIRESGDNGTPEVANNNKLTSEAFENLASSVIGSIESRNQGLPATEIVEITRS